MGRVCDYCGIRPSDFEVDEDGTYICNDCRIDRHMIFCQVCGRAAEYFEELLELDVIVCSTCFSEIEESPGL